MTSFVLSTTLIAQEPIQYRTYEVDVSDEMGRESIESEFIGYITRTISISPQQSQQFWPIYNENREKKKALRQSRRMLNKEKIGDDQRAEEVFDILMSYKEKEILLDKDLSQQLKPILSQQQILELFRGEENFKRFVLRGMKRRIVRMQDKSSVKSN